MTKGRIYWLGAHGKTGILDTRLKKVLKIFSGYNCDRILDVGCGSGYLLPRMGINGAGIAWLVTHGIIALVIVATSLRGR